MNIRMFYPWGEEYTDDPVMSERLVLDIIKEGDIVHYPYDSLMGIPFRIRLYVDWLGVYVLTSSGDGVSIFSEGCKCVYKIDLAQSDVLRIRKSVK